MNVTEFWNLVIGAITGLGVGIAFVVALFIAFCTVVGFLKLRPTSSKTMIIKNLEERVGQGTPARYLSSAAPSGQVDQLWTPELRDAAARQA